MGAGLAFLHSTKVPRLGLCFFGGDTLLQRGCVKVGLGEGIHISRHQTYGRGGGLVSKWLCTHTTIKNSLSSVGREKCACALCERAPTFSRSGEVNLSRDDLEGRTNLGEE